MSGDMTRPRFFCVKCGMVEYCDKHMRCEFPPDGTEKALKKRHKRTDCVGELVYCCGIMPARDIRGA